MFLEPTTGKNYSSCKAPMYYATYSVNTERCNVISSDMKNTYLRTCVPSEARSESSQGTFWLAKDAKFLHAFNVLTNIMKQSVKTITKTCLVYKFDPLKPNFYIVKLEVTGVYVIFLISAQKHRLWYSLEPPCRGGSTEYSQSMF